MEPVFCDEGEFFKEHQNCEYFYICQDGYPAELKQCPQGLYWNQELLVCDYPNNVPVCVGGTRYENY
jgi:hypothetical protein